ncbi:hypothetical protein FS837_010847 [Tulasnella sp. UAMH 9824]|nr:hypothetical protein FS837_010847 [Tulasnella sp. UAMH 9824]
METRSKSNVNPSPQRRSARKKGQQVPAIEALQTAHRVTPRRGSVSSQASTVDRYDSSISMLPTPPVSVQDEPLAAGVPRTRKGHPITPPSLTRRATHGRPRAGSQRSDQFIVPSPAKTNEPPKPWPPPRHARATKTPEPLEPDSDEVEVEMSLTNDQPMDDSSPLPALEPAQTSNLRSFGTTARASTPFIPPIPLRYTAWAVSSSAERLYPVAQPILHVSRIVKSEIQPSTISLGTSMETLKKGSSQSEALQSLQKYIANSIAYQNELIQISTRVEADLDNTRRDLSSAQKLILRLLPHRQEDSLPRNFEAEQQLLDILSRLYTEKLPSELQHLNVRLFELTQYWGQVHGALDGLRHSATALAGRDAAWARMAGTVTGLHGRMSGVNDELTKARSAVEHWQRDLALFKNPKEVSSNYVVSNSSLSRLVDRMNGSLDQLKELRHP